MDAQPLLIDSVAATTVHRDRDEIELALVQLLQQFLEAESVALLSVVRDAQGSRALPKIAAIARLDGGVDLVPNFPEPTDLDLQPAWKRCIEAHEVAEYRDAAGKAGTAIPVGGDGSELTNLLDVRSQNPLSPRDMHLVLGILRIIRNHVAVIAYGERDTLTGLLNRRTFESQFEKVRHEVPERRGDGEVSTRSWMGLVDIDRFKSINDRFGHLFGDEVLLLVSQIIQRTFRSSDRVYRFGGEEFVILLHHVPESAAGVALERVRAAVAAHAFPQIGNVTISIGWTEIQPQDGPTTSMERADAALYYAKEAGRNQVCRYETLLAAGKLAGAQATPEAELF